MQRASWSMPHAACLMQMLKRELVAARAGAKSQGLQEEAGQRVSIDVLAFYRPQVRVLRAALAWHGLLEEGVDVTTVDAMQGREADVIILSCVRSGCRNTLGFIQNRNRLNVALSRAREILYIIGHHSALKTLGSPEWQALLHHDNLCFEEW
jgi:superfamily I DNA and/or RNA helicase